MKSALHSALATDIHQPAQPLASAPKDSGAPRLPPLAIGNIDLIGEIFSTTHFELDVDRTSGTGLQSRHERTCSVPFTPLQDVPVDSTHGANYQSKRSYPM
jgi:hypothetical protein